MATKKLSKTVIEGGRTTSSKYFRRQSARTERHAIRQALTACHSDTGDLYDIGSVAALPKRNKSFKDFDDKLASLSRLLDSRLGRSWNRTYRLICEQFDTRTTSGRHIIFDHLLRMVWLHQDRSTKICLSYPYCLDKQGRLQRTKDATYRLTRKQRAKLRAENTRREKILAQWLNYRCVGKVGNVLYWYTTDVKKPIGLTLDMWGDIIRYFYTYDDPQYGSMYDPWRVGWRRDGRLDGRDIEFFTKLEPRVKTALLRSNPKKNGKAL